MSWQRARKPAQKEQRKAAILEAAARMFEEHGFEKVSLNGLAAEAGISKANVYRYFDSKEEIYLRLLLEDKEDWISSIERTLVSLAGTSDYRAFAKLITASILERPRLAALASVVSTVLERNVSVETIRWFKTEVMGKFLRLGNSILTVFPSLSLMEVRSFLLHLNCLLAGMWPASHPPENVVEALKDTELQMLCLDFSMEFEQAIVITLRGLLHSVKES